MQLIHLLAAAPRSFRWPSLDGPGETRLPLITLSHTIQNSVSPSVGLWFVYRIVRGWVTLGNSRPLYV